MRLLIAHLWPALAAAGALGLLAGAFGTAERAMSRSGKARVAVAALGLAGAALAVALQVLEAEAALWLETGLLLALAYGAGCSVATLLARLVRRAPPEPAAKTSA